MPADQPNDWLEKHAGALLQFALLHVLDQSAAEDLVQETLVAALKSGPDFEHRSSERTWLIGILRHKIIDHFRERSRRPASLEDTGDASQEFTRRGLWKHKPAPWRSPHESATSREFWDVLRGSLAELPEVQRAALVLRDLDGLEMPQICEILGVTPTNLGTLLHRGRSHVRRCMEQRGWGEREGTG